MINNIYTQIQTQEKATFDELFKQNLALIPTKPELSAFLKALENDKKIFQFGDYYYDLNKFQDVEGYVQWNLTGFCWLSDTNDMNEWGITFNPDDNLLSVYNKRDALYGHYINGKKVTLIDDLDPKNNREFVYITSSELKQEPKVIATYQHSRNEWVVLNSSTGFNFKHHAGLKFNLEQVPHGHVAIFTLKESKKEVDKKAQPYYEYVSSLGNMSDYGIESKIIAILSNIEPAPKATFEEVKVSNLKVLDKPFYTIDSIHTKDIDDAIWIERDKQTQQYHLWVAIADVSSYVLPGDAQDLHAKQACTSFYLPHDTVHMLDGQLAENFCSLNPGVKKQSMICEMRFDEKGELLHKDFYQAEILSQARLTYHDVDRIIEGVSPQESSIYKDNVIQKMLSLGEHENVENSLQVLLDFSKTQQRVDERDYWVVEQPEYHLGQDGKIDHLYAKDESAASQKMVETAMLAANICAAQFLYEKYPQFGMFRNQVEPEENAFPKPAFYDFNNIGHWGLKTEFYTHFTSPIRRYCDLLVHRLIKNIILNDEKLYTNEQLQEIAEQINLQQYKAKQFNIKSKNLLIPQYIEKLLATSSFNEQLHIIDFSDTGVVARNGQLIELFIPFFKLDKEPQRYLTKVLPEKGKVFTKDEKEAAVVKFNTDWNLYTKINNFVWTDERKTAFYQFSKRQLQNKNRL